VYNRGVLKTDLRGRRCCCNRNLSKCFFPLQKQARKIDTKLYSTAHVWVKNQEYCFHYFKTWRYSKPLIILYFCYVIWNPSNNEAILERFETRKHRDKWSISNRKAFCEFPFQWMLGNCSNQITVYAWQNDTR
jgi:hypothetical protein